MPSDVGYPLPPIIQRPQLMNRVDLNETKQLLKAKEDRQLEIQGVEQRPVQVVTQAREAIDARFPTESGVERFRGNTEGRNLSSVTPSASVTQLPQKVQAFNPATANSDRLSSLTIAEAAATGLTSPSLTPSINARGSEEITPELPSINGSGEIAARFDKIEEQIQLRATEEFEQLRPGGPESERVADERRTEDQRAREANQQVSLGIRNQELISQFRQQEARSRDQQVGEQQVDTRSIEQRGIELSSEEAAAQVEQSEENVASNNPSAPQTSEPGEPTRSDGTPLSSEEQQEVQRLARRDREVRAHEQAHARAGGRHVRGGVQLGYETGPDGKRYAVEGEVNVDLSPASTPEQTKAKMRQIRSAALAPANPSGADRAVAASASRREIDAQAQLNELARQDREELVKDQADGQPALRRSESERAGQSEQREVADHVAGAQAVIPDPSFNPRTSSGIEQQALQEYGAVYPMSSPPQTARPVSATPKKMDIKQSPQLPASPRNEEEGAREAE